MASINASKVDEWLEDDNLMLIEAWARDGCTYDMIAERIGIGITTLKTWRAKYPEIAKALKTGREIVDYKVENALLKSALGYTTKEIKVTAGRMNKVNKNFELIKETTIREIAPNVTACAIWLNNRLPDKWKRNRDNVVDLNEEDSNIEVRIIRGKKNSDEEDTTNSEISVVAKSSKSDNNSSRQKETAIKEDDSRDYWPDDWEE